MRSARFLSCAAAALAGVLVVETARAQHEHMDIYSTADGGGDLELVYDFGKTIDVFQVFCAGGLCLYSTINPAFMAPETSDVVNGHYALATGTTVSVEIVAADPKVTLNVDGHKLKKPGDAAVLGTMSPIHNHPSWQLVVPDGEIGEYSLSYKLRADTGVYGDSPVYTQRVSNLPQALPTPCPAYPCPADCDRDGSADVGEMASAVDLALLGDSVAGCASVDGNGDGVVTVDEIVAGAAAQLEGCPRPPPATLADIQAALFTPTCATLNCHDRASATGKLVLESGSSFAQLVGVAPDVQAAQDAGLLRVTPHDPEHSFLYQKLVGPRPEWGSRMPLSGACLPAERIDQVRRWIEAGAPE